MNASSTIRRLLSALLALLVLIVLGFSAQLAVSRGGLDFVQFYFAGQLVARGEIASIRDPEIYTPMIAELSAEDDRIAILVPWLYLTASAPDTPEVLAVTLTLGSLA